MEPVRTQVLIVGAGPTGLTLACSLARAGVSFHLIDKAAARSPYSRALVVHQRSMEIFNQLGIADALLAKGNLGNNGRIHVGRKLKAELPFFDGAYAGCRFRGALFVEQGYTEAVLDSCLSQFGHAPHFGHELVSFGNMRDGIRAQVRGPEGEYTVEAAYIAGCDGAHSAVRHGKGIAFEGSAYAQDFMLADVDLAWDQPRDSFMAFVDGRGFLALFPMRNKYRLVAARGRYSAAAPDPTLEDFRAVIQRLVPYKAEISNPTWLTRFHLHHRIARRFCDGRVLLAGDAAHIHSPVGGQGMNTGIQDAWNLGWKLANALRNPTCADALLDSYDRERYPVGKALLRTTDTAFNSVAGQSLLPKLVRTLVMPWLLPLGVRLPGLRRFAMYRVSQLGIGYRNSRIGGPDLDCGRFTRALQPGDRVPDIDIDGQSLHRMLDPAKLTLLAAGAPAGEHPWTALSLAAPTAQQRELLGLKTSGFFLIRPDAHLAARAATVAELKHSALSRLLDA